MKSLVLGVALLVSTSVMAAPSFAQPFEGPDFEAAVEAYIRANPTVLIDSINGYVEQQKAAEREAEDQRFLSMAADFAQIDGLPVLGNPDGSTTMHYVLDAACTYCRQMTPIVSGLLEANPDLKVVQHWVPFLTPASEYAARLSFLVFERFPDRYYEFYSELMKQTGQLTAEVVDGVLAGVVGEEQMAIIRSDATDGSDSMRVGSLVQRNLDVVTAAGVNGTPFFYVEQAGPSGILRGASPVQALQSALDRAAAEPAE